MVSDPHWVLGVSPGATEEEIKKAYRQKAKECHPDLHPDDPQANQKMNEVNEAYDMLMHPEKYQARQQQQQRQQSGGYGPYGGFGQQNPYGQQRQDNPYGYGQRGYGGWQSSGGWFDFEDMFGFGGPRQEGPTQPPQEMPGDSAAMRAAVRAIQMNRWQEAIGLLVQVPSVGRSARWHYLLALAQHGAGNTMTAQEEMQRAVQMDPDNLLYHQLLRQYREASQAYEQRAQGFNMTAMDPSRLCMGFCLANLLCNFCRFC